jgi:hypothetical protein
VIGRSGPEQITDDYPGDAPWPFVGGTIKRVIIDVSGESFADLAQEARAALRPAIIEELQAARFARDARRRPPTDLGI